MNIGSNNTFSKLFCPVLVLKLNFRKYLAIYTNYSWSNCTISNKKDLNQSSEFLVIN